MCRNILRSSRPRLQARIHPERAQHHAADDAAKRDHVGMIFNALIIVALIPLALRGVPYRAVGAAALCATTF